MTEKYDITDYLKDDKELQKAVIEEFLKENAELKAYMDVNEDFKTAWEELKAENERLKEDIKYLGEEKKEKIQLLEQIINILYPGANDDELFTITFNSEYIDKLKKIQQTLQEIKAISEKFIKNVSEDCINITPMFLVHKEILQKITKAESEG